MVNVCVSRSGSKWLRLAALEIHLEQALPLPFIADDLFINYDDARSKAGFEALKALSEQTQVILLSHHDQLIPTVQAAFGEQADITNWPTGKKSPTFACKALAYYGHRAGLSRRPSD